MPRNIIAEPGSFRPILGRRTSRQMKLECSRANPHPTWTRLFTASVTRSTTFLLTVRLAETWRSSLLQRPVAVADVLRFHGSSNFPSHVLHRDIIHQIHSHPGSQRIGNKAAKTTRTEITRYVYVYYSKYSIYFPTFLASLSTNPFNPSSQAPKFPLNRPSNIHFTA